MKKAFTLVELIVVIGIICILVGVLVASFSGSTESARAVKCLANMRTLAQYGSSGDVAVSSGEDMSISENAEVVYSEIKGWISSDTRNCFPADKRHDSFKPISLYETDRETALFALTNGWMFAKVGRNREVFVCPTHAKLYKKQPPHWSYVMWNGLNDTPPELTLLFAEVPFLPTDERSPSVTDRSELTDAVLQGPTVGGKEYIGGNHKAGKNTMAHVAFADGHVEKLKVDGLTDNELKELTTWLCQGKAVGLNAGRYEEIE